ARLVGEHQADAARTRCHRRRRGRHPGACRMSAQLDLDRIARDTHAAMTAPPDYVQLAAQLTAAETRTERDALLGAAAPTTREAALRYLAEPETTRERDRRLDWMRADPRRIAALRHYYADHVADFISDWGYTTDPRRIARNELALVPFV